MRHVLFVSVFLSACFELGKETNDEERDEDSQIFFEGDRYGDCIDGEDNDEDGLVDCDDPGCYEREACTEDSIPQDTAEPQEETGSEGNAESLLINYCSGCHSGSLAPDLSANICDNLVNVPSTQAPSVNYITPEDPENSYLWHKVNGTAGTAGGVDSIMPVGGSLSAPDLTIIEDWINNGAVCESPVEDDEEPDESLANGEDIHDSMCMGCHEGIPSMAEQVPNMTDEQIQDVVQNGRGAMPAINLSEAEIIDLIVFLRVEYPSK